eukprot:13864316-Alexandrium_andersonii.AAC.1
MTMRLPTLALYEVFAAIYAAGPQFYYSMLGITSDSAVPAVLAYWDELGQGYHHHVTTHPDLAPHR